MELLRLRKMKHIFICSYIFASIDGFFLQYYDKEHLLCFEHEQNWRTDEKIGLPCKKEIGCMVISEESLLIRIFKKMFFLQYKYIRKRFLTYDFAHHPSKFLFFIYLKLRRGNYQFVCSFAILLYNKKLQKCSVFMCHGNFR
jgi:hypothetical protein